MDDADMSQIRAEREEALRPKPKTKLLDRTGFCHYCDEPIGPDSVFCNLECSVDYDKLQRGRLYATGNA